MKSTFTLLLAACFCLTTQPVQAQNLQGSFETWRTLNSGMPPTQLEAPQGWFGLDSLVYNYGPLAGITPAKLLFKDMSSHSGSYAAKIVSKDMGGTLGVVTGMLANADPMLDLANFDPSDPLGALTYSGGTPISQRIDEIKAWIKYAPGTGDNALISVRAVVTQGGTDVIVGEGSLLLTQAYGNFTQVAVPVTYINSTIVPEKLLIGFYSSYMASANKGTGGGSTPVDGSTLYIDDVDMITLDIEEMVSSIKSVKLFPVPANNTLHIHTELPGTLSWQAFDMNGRRVKETLFQGTTSVDISALSSGLYLYKISGKNGEIIQRGKFHTVK